ncbi:MAG: Rpn family recombination-promoting nuclease/putative transposase [Bacteroidota bacterium]
MQYVDPKVDIAFKKIFGDKNNNHILISFLNAVMDKDIVSVTILNPYQLPKLPELKYTILDVKAEDSKGEEYIVEMQTNPYVWFDKRALDYISRAYASQLESGSDYKDHKPVYFIGVLNFDYFKSQEYLSRHFILNLETYKQEITDFELYFLELTKFTKELHELEGILDKWTYFLKKLQHLAVLPKELASVPAIVDAAASAQQSTWTKDELDAYYKLLREEAKELNLIKELEIKDQELQTKDQELQIKDQELQIKDQELQTKDEELRHTIQRAVKQLHMVDLSPDQIANSLGISTEEVSRILASLD